MQRSANMRVSKFAMSLAIAFILGLASGSVSKVQAATYNFAATLSGANEVAPVVTTGTGQVNVQIDTDAFTMQIDVTFSGLLGATTAAHIHCCTTVFFQNAGVATQTGTFVGFPIGVTSGTYSHLFDMTTATSFNAPFIASNGGTALSAFDALVTGMLNGSSYFNLHTVFRPGGEIRGNLAPVPVPAALPLLASGLAALGFLARRRAPKALPEIQLAKSRIYPA